MKIQKYMDMKFCHEKQSVNVLFPSQSTGFWATATSNGLPYAMGPLSCLSVTLVYCG